jgi:hypothetical protein
MQPNKSWKKLTIVAIVAGVVYDSWPLGYWLNPVVARKGLASELEAIHQPFNWVFVSGDIVSSLFIGLVAYILWMKVHKHVHAKIFKISLINIAIFSILTIADALTPMHCDPSIQSCPNFLHDRLLLVHGIYSIGASVALFVSVFVIWQLDRRSRLMNTVMFGYLLFSLFSLLSLFTPGQNSWAQHYYITLCSVWLAALPYAVLRTNRRKKKSGMEKHALAH